MVLCGWVLWGMTGCFDLQRSTLSRPGDGGDSDTDTFIDPCDACTRQNCRNEVEDCNQQLSCLSLQSCLDECQRNPLVSTSACDSACVGQFYDVGYYTNVTVCQSEHCTPQCDRPCGGWTYRMEECRGCMQDRCCELTTDCANNPKCLAWFTCIYQCAPGDFGCYVDCDLLAGAKALRLVYDFQNCFVQKCTVPCKPGQAWECVGHTTDVQVTPRESDLRLRFYDILGVPIEGVSVKMCVWTDATCKTPLVSAQSAEDGSASLHFQPYPAKYRLEISKPGRMPAELTFSTHLSGGPAFSFEVILPTPEELGFLANTLQVQLQPDRGHLLMYLEDCTFLSARDVVVLASGQDGATPFYVRNFQTDMAADRTDYSGMAGFFNLSPGAVKIEAAPFEEQHSPVIKETLFIKSGVLSVGHFWPH